MTLGYFALAVTSMSLTRFDGGLAFIWVANAWLLAELVHLPVHRWGPTLGGAAIASMVATGLFGLGPAAAPAMALCAIVEATLGATLLARFRMGQVRLDSLRATAVFAVVCGGIAPMATAFLAAATATLAIGGDFGSHLVHSFVGHSLGTISFAPMLLLALDGRLARFVRGGGWRGARDAALPILLSVAVIGVTFAQTRFPLLFLPMLPLVLMSFRFGQIGAAFTVLLIAILGGGLTIAGYGPIQLIALLPGQRIQFFQFYLAAAVLIALPVAAELSHRRRLFRDLANSEARFRMLATRSSDVIMSTDRRGRIEYLSPSIAELGNYMAADLLGTSAADLVHPDDRAPVAAQHLKALAAPDAASSFEYRGRVADGTYRWFESSIRGVVDASGQVTGIISAIRDVTHRKQAEHAMALAAATDPLTGLCNRRAFVGALADRLADAGPGRAFCAIVDFDHFKRINDGLGHDAGDRALVAFARVAARLLQPGEMVARIGGEEFALLLTRPGPAAARQACEQLRCEIAALKLRTHVGAPIALTVSIGCAPIVRGLPAGAAMAAADAALYRAKGAGRDCVVLADDPARRPAPVFHAFALSA